MVAAENRWWYENTATWMEDVCYDEVNDYVRYLHTNPNPLSSPELSIMETTNNYEYAGAIWPMFLHEYYNIASPRRVWERIGERGAGAIALASIDWVLRNTYLSSLSEALEKYAIWRYFTGTYRFDNLYHFSESHLWPESYVLRSHNTYPASGNQGTRNPSGPGGANFVQFFSGTEDLLNITFDGQDGYDWGAFAVGYRFPQQSIEREIPLDDSGRGTTEIPWQGNDHIALIAVVTDWTPPQQIILPIPIRRCRLNPRLVPPGLEDTMGR
jgi:hypothetical protein